MTGAEASALVTRIAGTWPGVKISDAVTTTWLDRLVALPAGDGSAAYEILLARGSAFAPSLAEFVAAVAEVQQGPPPTEEQADEIVRRHAGRWPYRGHCTAGEHTVGAVRQLMAAGVHEAVCRWVQQAGGWTVAEMPDARAGLDRDGQIRRHELLRAYRTDAVGSWRADPSPGLALARAEAQHALGCGSSPRRLEPGRFLIPASAVAPQEGAQR